MISESRPVVKVNMQLDAGNSAGTPGKSKTWEQQCQQLLSQVFNNVVIQSLEVCTGGITNRLFKVQIRHDGQPAGEVVLIRVYGKHTDCIIDRLAEVENMGVLGREGLAGQLYGQFENGLVYSYISGQPLTNWQLQEFAVPIARELSRWHSLRLPTSNGCDAYVFKTINSWMERVKGKLTIDQQEYFKAHTNRLQEEYKHSKLVFCHNDLLAPNIIKTGDNAVKFIDYEYAAYNLPWFDIANHFCEYAGFDCDWSRLPDEHMQTVFLRAYFECAGYGTDSACGTNGGSTTSTSKIMYALKAIRDFMPVAHLFWGLWALIQADLSEIDFDYAGYGRLRLERARFAE